LNSDFPTAYRSSEAVVLDKIALTVLARGDAKSLLKGAVEVALVVEPVAIAISAID
jgi:hypothetical protein